MPDCIFCKIIRKDIPTELIYESEGFIVIKDISPQAPVHLLIITKEHIPSVDELAKRHQQLVGDMVLQARELAKIHSLQNGYKLVVNCGPDGGQVVPHLHIHMLGGKKLSGLT
ncbi:MAG: histidine triad nucleotide-binding protein [Patescibacteria group bacterium]|jgi:histidine triad (HIT) family protein